MAVQYINPWIHVYRMNELQHSTEQQKKCRINSSIKQLHFEI